MSSLFSTGIRAALAILVASSVSGCSAAQEVPANWKLDCVGRMQLGFPGDVEIAATTRQDLQRRWRPRPSSFADGQMAAWASLVYAGDLEIIHGLSAVEVENFMAQRLAIREKFLADANAAKEKTSPFDAVRDLPVAHQNGVGFEAQGQRILYLRLGEQVLSWGGYTGLTDTQAKHDYELILNGVRSRGIFQLPSEPGICIPYAFIKDDGMASRGVRMVYRLREHPDITVLLQDASAASLGSDQRKEVLTAKYRTNDFWGQYAGDTLQPAWSPVARDVKLAGQSGMQTFVQFVRKDGTQDYGYLAVAPGDPDAKEDTPDLMLYVIRDAKNAKAKGIEPMSKEAFLEMAQTIAASVKRRPVSQ